VNLARTIKTLRHLLLFAVGTMAASHSICAAGTDQNITFVFINDKTYGDPAFGVQALASSGLNVNFSILSGPATVTGTTVTITGVGTVVIAATQPGNATWNPASATNVFHVAPAVLNVVADDKFKIYGSTNPPLTYTLNGFVYGQNASVISGNPTLTTTAATTSSIGAYNIVAGAGTLQAANYTFNFIEGKLSISKASLTVTADTKSKVFGASEPALTYQITSGTLFGSDTLSGSITRAAGENAGTYAITQNTLAAGGNYTLTFVGANLTISPVNLIVAADAQSKVYGAEDPALIYEIVSGALVGSDTLSGALTRVAGENVGNYHIGQGTLAASANYAVTFVSANLTITPATLAVAANDVSRRYGAANPTFAYMINGLVNGDNLGVVTGAPSVTTTATSTSPVGNYSIKPALGTLSAANYTFDFVDGKLSVLPAKLTVTADPQAKLYGEADPAFTYQITSGMLFGTDALTGALTRNAGQGVGTYTITQGTLTAGSNYTLTFIGTNLTVSPVTLTITAENKSRAFGAANPELTCSIIGFVNGEDPSVLSGTPYLGTAADTQSPVGDYLIIIDFGTLASTNYTFAFYDGALSVTPVQLTVTADAQGKTYGTADPALTCQITSGALVGADTLTGSLTRVAGENVGSYAIGQGTIDAGSNYEITFVGADLVISTAGITVAADAKTKIYGTTDPGLTYHIVNGALVGPDAFAGSLTRAVGETVGTYGITRGTLTAGGNYSLTYVGTNLTITPKAITVTADAKSKTYGAADPGLTYQITSGALVGADAITGALARNVGENAGTYAINQGVLNAGTNYNLTFAPSSLTINRASLAESLGSSRNSAPSGANVTFTATLSVIQPGAGIPGGAVQFVVDGAAYGSPAALSNGVASMSTAALPHGYHTVMAAYAGNSNFFGSTNALNQLINQPPVAQSDTASTAQNTPLSGSAAALLANDSDGDSDAISVTSVSAGSLMGGTASLVGGTWTYTPPANFSGTDAFAYTVTDSYNETATSFVIVTVNPGVNLPQRVVSLEPLAGGSKRLTISGKSGAGYIVQASTNLTSWIPISTNTCDTNGLFLFTDSAAANFRTRFYRTVSQ